MDAFDQVKEVAGSISLSDWIAAAAVISILYMAARSVYYLYFHPYAKFPGPAIAKVTDAWYTYHWLTGRYPWAIEAAFKKYGERAGDVVRIAPNECAFLTPQAATDILMSGTKGKPTFTKTEFYLVFGQYAGIAAEDDPEKHRKVRKAMAPAFSPRHIKEMDVAMHRIIDDAIAKLEKHGAGKDGVNMSEWFDWIACDLAGATTYGHDFGNLKNTKSSLFLEGFMRVAIWGTLQQTFRRFPLLHPLVFLMLPPSIARRVPWLLAESKRIVKERVERRHKLEHQDLLTPLVSDDKPLPNIDWLVAQANHLILGGVDPGANVWTAAVLFLLQNPEKLKKLQDEIRGTFSSYDSIEDEELTHLPWLTAVIEESMRVHSNAAFGMPRYSPGAYVDGHYIPKGCRVQTSTFALWHHERYWAKPRSFCPERWLPADHPDYDPIFANDVHEAFRPFSMGPRSCIGQNVGYRQARVLLAKMVWKLDWELVNADSINWERDLRLYAVWMRPPVMVRYKVAEHARERPTVKEKPLLEGEL